jgi:hypothetical protein
LHTKRALSDKIPRRLSRIFSPAPPAIVVWRPVKENCACSDGKLKQCIFHPQIWQIFTDWWAARLLLRICENLRNLWIASSCAETARCAPGKFQRRIPSTQIGEPRPHGSLTGTSTAVLSSSPRLQPPEISPARSNVDAPVELTEVRKVRLGHRGLVM